MSPVPRRPVATGIGPFVIVLLALQIFLLTLALDALLGDDSGLAWVTAASSVVLAVASIALYNTVRSR
jgi:hypothetical protein